MKVVLVHSKTHVSVRLYNVPFSPLDKLQRGNIWTFLSTFLSLHPESFLRAELEEPRRSWRTHLLTTIILVLNQSSALSTRNSSG